ncbi:FAD-binding protein [Micromonospora zamorensis]|uniref:FAD-binding protein n=1 Tax=Micromonospora zamorensis TaxID=709883 RepID=UPI003D99784F
MDRILPADRYLGSHCGVLVIGSGTSGLATALELAAHGVEDVVVVDHGPFAGFEHDTRTSPTPRCPPPPADWRASSRHYQVPPGVALPVGGRSRGWQGVVMPINETVLRQRWPHQVVEELHSDGPGSYAGVLRDLAEWRGEPVTTAQTASDTGVQAAWNDVLDELPVAPVPQIGRYADSDSGRQYWVYSPLMAWRGDGVPRYHGLALPTIVHGLQALHLVTDHDAVTGAAFRLPDGTTRTITADTVVLAAGALENTRLYAQALGAVREPVLNWPGLNDHLTHGIVVPLPESLRDGWSAPDRAFLMGDLEARFNGNLFVDVHAAGMPEPILDLWWIAQQVEPFPDSISFQADSPVWSARIESKPNEADELSIARRDEFAIDLLTRLGVKEIDQVAPDAIAVAIGRALGDRRAVRYHHAPGIADHEAGTLSLGTHLLPGGRSSWAANLYVAGPASFPTPGAANPTLTILALGAQTAAAIADADRRVPAPRTPASLSPVQPLMSNQSDSR